MDRTLRSPRLPAVVLLLLCALPSCASAQQFVCWPIAAGDTASSLARRLTGNSDGAYGLAFQIRDPARRMFVPKSHYQRIKPDWQACVASGPVPKTPVVYAPVVELAASATVAEQPIAAVPQPAASMALTVASADRTRTYVPFAAPIAGGAAVLILLASAVAGSLTRRPIPPSVQRAGENFVVAFARPLIDESSSVPPIRTRLRYLRRTQQLEIFIAPGPGRRYPNLADHKKNVDYDVNRVLRLLGNHVLSKPPRAAGKWVVVTITRSGGFAPRPPARSLEARSLTALALRDSRHVSVPKQQGVE